MGAYLAAIFVILAIAAMWVVMDRMARAFAARHPEFGPYRAEGSGCCGGCRGPCRKQESEPERPSAAS